MSTLKKTKRNRRQNNQLKNPTAGSLIVKTIGPGSGNSFDVTFGETIVEEGGVIAIGPAVRLVVNGLLQMWQDDSATFSVSNTLASDGLTLHVLMDGGTPEEGFPVMIQGSNAVRSISGVPVGSQIANA